MCFTHQTLPCYHDTYTPVQCSSFSRLVVEEVHVHACRTHVVCVCVCVCVCMCVCVCVCVCVEIICIPSHLRLCMEGRLIPDALVHVSPTSSLQPCNWVKTKKKSRVSDFVFQMCCCMVGV